MTDKTISLERWGSRVREWFRVYRDEVYELQSSFVFREMGSKS